MSIINFIKLEEKKYPALFSLICFVLNISYLGMIGNQNYHLSRYGSEVYPHRHKCQWINALSSSFKVVFHTVGSRSDAHMTVCRGFKIYYQHRVLHLSEDVVNNENLNDVYAAKLSIFSKYKYFLYYGNLFIKI